MTVSRPLGARFSSSAKPRRCSTQASGFISEVYINGVGYDPDDADTTASLNVQEAHWQECKLTFFFFFFKAKRPQQSEARQPTEPTA